MWCSLPFSYLEIFGNEVRVCCWGTEESIYRGPGIKEGWNSPLFQDIRESLNKGSGRYCTGQHCPYFLANQGRSDYRDILPPLQKVRLSFDETCNLRCRSCRTDFKKSDPEVVQKRLDEVYEISENIEQLELCGAGDPIASPTFRKFLQTLDLSKFGKLHTIKLHTNAQLLTEEVWNTFPEEVQEKIKSIGVSVDAATKETYEKIRRGGKYEILLKNLEFLGSKIPSWEFDFVVQQDNWTEVFDFYKFVESFKEKHNLSGVIIFFQNLEHWGWSVPVEEYNKIRVDNDPEIEREVVKQIDAAKREAGKNSIQIMTTCSLPTLTLQEVKAGRKLV